MVEILNKLIELDDKMESLSLSTKDILNMDEAITYLKVSRSYLYKLTSTKEIPHYKPTGKLIYFRRKELTQWILRNRESSNEEIQDELFNNLKRKTYGPKF